MQYDTKLMFYKCLNFTLMLLFLAVSSAVTAQQFNNQKQMVIKGEVVGYNDYVPFADVEVTTDNGEYTKTNTFGEFTIKALVGDVVTFRSSGFETIRYTITNDEDIKVVVKDGTPTGKFKKRLVEDSSVIHSKYLDSAQFYKKGNIEKSIDFITKSISVLGVNASGAELAKSLTTLGEVYQFHQQYDLAITNYLDAQKANKTIRTGLLLGRVYVITKNYTKAEELLFKLVEQKNMIPFQRVELYETLGDAYKGLGNIDSAVSFYEEGLKVANKNQITPKVTDLNSKIGEAYSAVNRNIEAEGFYNNSLLLAGNEAPQRAIQEKEKVADFYNKRSRFDEEITLRKKTLKDLNSLKKPVENKNAVTVVDSITSQRINYKIANAYIAQDKYTEAIPYLEKSIVEADYDDDLIVQKDATRKLSEVYKTRGDFTKAFEAYQNYVTLVDTLYIRKEQEISRAARFNREISSKQNRISGLEQERELSQSKYDLAITEQALARENYKRQKWLIYSLIFGILLMGVAAFFFYRSNQQQKLANNLLALKSLRSQMNPHFIFNALNSVNNYIAKSDERSANRFLSEFSTLMRSVLENSEEDFIPLPKELQLLELYVKLEHSRFPDKFSYELTIDETIDTTAYQIPPMLLQPYIENAIWHGLRYKQEKGYLHIKVNPCNKDSIAVTIADNGIGRKHSAAVKTQHQKKQKSKGMGNIKKRVAILNDMYKDKIEVSITDLNEDGTGTLVTLVLKRN